MNKNCVKIGYREFTDMLSCGYSSLLKKEEEVNNLNVFPVPDGDTGKNMRMTYESGINALKKSNVTTVGETAEIFAKGALLGARGNSGVILSQIFKGFAQGLKGCEEADAEDIINAFSEGVKKSYKAVVKPVEGTMLTVFRECSECASECGKDMPIDELFKNVERRCKISLENTPNLLQVLKDAGVVDSGGAGLLCIFRGYLNYFNGKEDYVGTEEDNKLFTPADMSETAVSSEEEFGYCTEFLITLSAQAKDSFDTDLLVAQLESIGGQSIVALRDEDIVKVHVHVLTPGDVLNIAQQYGEFLTIKIENMSLQHSELVKNSEVKVVKPLNERIGVATVVVADQGGFKDLFYNMGADCVVNGGQSMNPSVEDFLKAFNEVNAKDIIVLPNNSNVIMAAKQASEIFSEATVHVVPTRTIAQGYSALSIYNPDEDVEVTVADMQTALSSVISAEITRAVRDAKCDGVDIAKSDVMVIVDGKVSCADKDMLSAFSSALSSMEGLEDKCVITFFCGEGATEELTKSMTEHINADYPFLEVSIVETAQPVYDYIIAVE
ncbi:MAG: DAK2 domain-containing protein [Candidatus Coproplasma sp.]